MIQIETPSSPEPEPDTRPDLPPTLASLSRNASAISTSSSDSAPSPVLTARPRPRRNFSAPRSQSPRSVSPRSAGAPHYLAKEFGYADNASDARIIEHTRKARSISRGSNAPPNVGDFMFGLTLGEGSYSTVKLATHIPSGKQYAIKVLEKSHLYRKDKMSTAFAERDALKKLGAGHPGVVRLYYTFQDEGRLYFVIDLARNGEMQSLISRLGSLSLRCAQYYAAQVVDAIDYMHSKGVIHRDLKPENLLLDDSFRIKLTDFGTSKVLQVGVETSATWVGTAQYIAPELLDAKETSKSSDFWAVGCIIYQMIAGRFAFHGLSEYLTWQKIKSLEYTFPEGFDKQAQDLVGKLLIREPANRLGVGILGSTNDMKALRSHPFFESINWETLWTDPPPPIEPGLVKRDSALIKEDGRNWEDVGAAWDDLVNEDANSELVWDTDANIKAKDFGNQLVILENGVGPLVDSYTSPEVLPGSQDSSSVSTIQASVVPNDLAPAVPPFCFSDSNPDGESGPASEPVIFSPVNFRSASGHATDIDKPVLTQEEDLRGRNKAMSPIQGNGPAPDSNFAAILNVSRGEEILYNSAVEERSLRRRASRLFPLPVTSKPKTRQLILTTRRLLCLKQGQKVGSISIKTELSLRASEKLKEKGKEKEMHSVISNVERKGEREFVVMTPSKNYQYSAKDPNLASTWTTKINEAIKAART